MSSDLLNSLDSIESARKSTYEKYKDKFTNNKNDLITIDNFYTLLVAEMQNQDPLEPSSNTEFISQMASFTALQSQQDAFKTQQQSYANSLVGQTVTVNDDKGDAITGKVSYVTLGDTPMVNVNGKNYPLSSIKQFHTNANEGTSSIGDYGAFATGLLGKQAVVQFIDTDGTPYYDEGIVKSLEIENGEVRVIVNGYAYNVSDVVKVTEPENVQETAPVDKSAATETVQPTTSQTEAAASQQAAAADSEDEVEYTEEEDIADISETDELMKLFDED